MMLIITGIKKVPLRFFVQIVISLEVYLSRCSPRRMLVLVRNDLQEYQSMPLPLLPSFMVVTLQYIW
jgi:hypothetical protein